MVSLEWGSNQKITNLSEQMVTIQNWTQNKNNLDDKINGNVPAGKGLDFPAPENQLYQ